MSSWLRRARSTHPKPQGSGTETTVQDDNKSSPSDNPLMKSHTHTSFFQFRNKPGQPALLPITISAYNLDWDELLPFLKRTFPEQKFPVMQLVEDHYLVYLPRILKEEDKREIDLIKKAHRERVDHGAGGRPRREEHSPDGPRQPLDEPLG